MGSKRIRLASWNVNGLRACAKKGFYQWLDASKADVVGLQEIRLTEDQIIPEMRPQGWDFRPTFAARPGYSGVAFYSKIEPDAFRQGLGRAEFDDEGRVAFSRYGKLLIANSYFPNGSGKDRDNSRVDYKLKYYRELWDQLEAARRDGLHVVVMGDFNTAHLDIDLARPKENRKTSGFLPEECAEFDRWLASGWVDSFRVFEKGPGHYSWWSQRQGARARNVGWRIDYVLVAREALPYLKAAFIEPEIAGSDHCPVGIELDADVR
jgi:exodeoxyribonuclease-3